MISKDFLINGLPVFFEYLDVILEHARRPILRLSVH